MEFYYLLYLYLKIDPTSTSRIVVIKFIAILL